jgi:hypothetical protein
MCEFWRSTRRTGCREPLSWSVWSLVAVSTVICELVALLAAMSTVVGKLVRSSIGVPTMVMMLVVPIAVRELMRPVMFAVVRKVAVTVRMVATLLSPMMMREAISSFATVGMVPAMSELVAGKMWAMMPVPAVTMLVVARACVSELVRATVRTTVVPMREVRGAMMLVAVRVLAVRVFFRFIPWARMCLVRFA